MSMLKLDMTGKIKLRRRLIQMSAPSLAVNWWTEKGSMGASRGVVIIQSAGIQ